MADPKSAKQESATPARPSISCVRRVGARWGWLAVAAMGCSLDATPATSSVQKGPSPTWQPPSADGTRTIRTAAEVDASLEMTLVMPVRRPPGEEVPDASELNDSSTAPAADAPPPVASDAGATSPPAGASAMPPASTTNRDAGMPMQVDAAMNQPAATAGAASPSPTCMPGVYAGTFTGSLQAVGLPVSTVTGAINANLTMDIFGLYLNVRDLRVVGSDESGNTLTVTVSGNINCTTLQLEDGLLENGTYYMINTATQITFVGVAQGTYSLSPHAVNGTWYVEAQDSFFLGGDGGFSLVLVQ